MFKKSKSKEEKKTTVSKMGGTTTTTTTTTSKSGFQRRLSENVTERSLTYQSTFTSSSTSYSSMRVTNLEKSTILSQRPGISKNSSLFDTSTSASNGTGYQSPFSRKLPPFSFDARPFNTNQLSPLTATKKIAAPAPAASQNLLRYSSYVPERRNEITSSTHSLPISNQSIVEDPRIPTYNTKGKKRGKVVIINNIKFLQQKQERKGAEKDEKDIKSLFKGMGFEVEVYRDLKKNAMMDRVKRFSKDTSLKNVDMSILIMMSHGSNIDNTGTVIQGGFTQIYGTDDQGLPIEEVLDKFSVANCSAMAGKPKIFIFQCCRGEGEETTLHVDVTPTAKALVKSHADMLVAFSTLPGFFSIRDAYQGSWYIQCICDVFKKYAKELDVETLLKIVDDNLSKKHPKYQQTSSYESRGFKRCFLNPM